MGPALAFFITWTCHGTWLHGDNRTSVDRTHRGIGHPRLPPSPPRRASALRLMTRGPVTLDDQARDVVNAAIRRHCALRRWNVHALNVRTNHVHVVVSAPATPERVMNQLKAWSTRRLREAGLIASDRRVWTEHGSTRWINDERSLAAAVAYVVKGQ